MDNKLMLSFLVLVAFGAAIMVIGLQEMGKNPAVPTEEGSLKKFNSYADLQSFLKKNQQTGGYYYGIDKMIGGPMVMMKTTSMETTAVPSAAGRDFSTTNVQVQGVDEADIVKTDGSYIYVLSGSRIVIARAVPAKDAEIVEEISLKGSPYEFYVNGDRLVVFGYDYTAPEPIPLEESGSASSTATRVAKPSTNKMMIRPSPSPSSYSFTYINLYDISDKESPELVKDVKVSGNYFDSRMIGGHVYAIINSPVYNYRDPVLPIIMEGNVKKEIKPEEIYYFPYPDYSYNYLNVIALDVNDGEYESKHYLSGSAQNIYASADNIYLAYHQDRYLYSQDRMWEEVVLPMFPESVASTIRQLRQSDAGDKWEKIQSETNKFLDSLTKEEKQKVENDSEQRRIEFEEKLARERERTVIQKIAIGNGKIAYKGQGSVPGTVLNQFSMDEHKGYLRVATTAGNVWSNGKDMSRNNVYVLNEEMNVVGMVEDLAPGEKIYSARFMGNRAYMVTFKKVDPLFVIDLKDPYNPKVLGKLKIPGYSDYLHPYDENHIIGLGKEAVESEEGNFAWYQGMKLALFDVSDPENPKEVSKFSIGDRGTDSYALQDHKAFLFSKEKNLLVIPVLLAEIDKEKYSGKVPGNAYGDYTWQGAYVLNLDLEKGFQLKGRITHVEDDSLIKSGYYYSSPSSVKRSLYIGNSLYTVSDTHIKANNLDTMEEVAKVKLPYAEQPPYVLY